MKNKKLVIALIALVAVIAVFLGIWLITRADPEEGMKSFTVTVVHADGTRKEFSYQSDGEYLGPVLLEEGLVTGEMGPYGLYIHSVDGEEAVWEAGAASGAFWNIYIGEELAVTGADQIILTDGGSYKLVYERG